LFDKLLNLLGGNKGNEPSSLTDFSQMAVDLHSHLIPGIDDGVKFLEESVDILREFKRMGFSKVITTPHVMPGGFDNTPENILAGRDKVREALRQNNIDIAFDAAAEYYLDSSMYEKIEKKELLTLGRDFVLIEFPMNMKPMNIADAVYKMQVGGYNVILAHPERYPYYYETSMKGYNELKDRGIYLQINMMSLAGRYGKQAKHFAEKMIDTKMVDFIGTDLHGMRHIEAIRECLPEKYLEKLLLSGNLMNKSLL
jgi:tyrosine-protein phosphatase YwqE